MNSGGDVETRRPWAPVRIGLTGPIGCGKSTVAGWLGEMGAVVIDADRVAHAVTGIGMETTAEIATAFGAGVLRGDGSLDRVALAELVFGDERQLAKLEAIVHPAVRAAIVDELARADDAMAAAVVIEAIKLVEGGLASICDEVWLITCDPAAQWQRLERRGMSAPDATARIRAQGDMERRVRAVATRVIDTSGTEGAARSDVASAWIEATGARGRAPPGQD